MPGCQPRHQVPLTPFSDSGQGASQNPRPALAKAARLPWAGVSGFSTASGSSQEGEFGLHTNKNNSGGDKQPHVSRASRSYATCLNFKSPTWHREATQTAIYTLADSMGKGPLWPQDLGTSDFGSDMGVVHSQQKVYRNSTSIDWLKYWYFFLLSIFGNVCKQWMVLVENPKHTWAKRERKKKKNQNHLWSSHQKALIEFSRSYVPSVYVQSFRPQTLEPLCKSVAWMEGFRFSSHCERRQEEAACG